MCGRFALTTTPEEFAEVFEIEVAQLRPRYNIAPGQGVATLLARGEGGWERQERRWGLIPSWARDPKIGYRMINARAETVAEKPAFRGDFRQRRCLIPASGFYEWKKMGQGRDASRQAYFIELRDEPAFGMAGLWGKWVGPEGETVESCSVMTTRASDGIARLHPRMPVILPRTTWEHWLDPDNRDVDSLLPLLAPFDSEALAWRTVSPLVNDARIDTPACLAAFEPLERPEQGALF